MSSTTVTLFGVVACLCFANALKLPSYIVPCSKTDPNLNQCAVDRTKDIIPILIKGDPKYHVPAMNPLEIPEIDISGNKELSINLKNSIITGLEGTVVNKIDLDLENKKIVIQASVPVLNLQGEYNIKGQILVLPINGQGPCNLTLVGGEFTYTVEFKLIERDGKEYAQLETGRLEHEATRAYFQLDNLFGGDSALGDEMNKLLNQNWKDVVKDIGPAVTETISTIINTIFNGIVEHVPYDEIFLP